MLVGNLCCITLQFNIILDIYIHDVLLPGGPWITVKLSVNPALMAFSCESLLRGRYINDDERAVSTWSTSGHNRSRTGSLQW